MLCANLTDFYGVLVSTINLKGENMKNMNLDDLVFDYYCFVEHMDFMNDVERELSSISFEELGIL